MNERKYKTTWLREIAKAKDDIKAGRLFPYKKILQILYKKSGKGKVNLK